MCDDVCDDVLQSKREEREREKTLQKRIGELQTQTQRLERRIMLLRTENDTLVSALGTLVPLHLAVHLALSHGPDLCISSTPRHHWPSHSLPFSTFLFLFFYLGIDCVVFGLRTGLHTCEKGFNVRMIV